MGLPFWVLAAGVAGVFGALGAVVGWVAEKLGLKFGRFLAIAAMAGGLAFTRLDGFHAFYQSLTWSDQQTEATLTALAPALYSYIRTEYPDDYSKLISETTAIVRSSSGAQGVVERKSAELMQSMRHKYAQYIAYAPAEYLRALLAAQIDFYRQLNGDDPVTCAKAAINGPISLVGTGFSQHYGYALIPQVLAMLKAAKSGQVQPVSRHQASDDDWLSIGDEMQAEGAPDDYLVAITELDPDNADTCPALIAFLQALGNLDTGGAELVLAEYLSSMAAS